ncbi:NfeD family protein [Roseofilum capinflatum]|uniref:NfeD family protein n=1 Tax=Roseofilum capinflatum BLCC-M114 TaxID=3022440 RepID=A0ABT7BDX9_9CYAN|nr:NfeD family protein [Roseofilum capinflatum]MDJ1176992.1 NfeD family protein [Roseofilum capinflatum BLCC-M114]
MALNPVFIWLIAGFILCVMELITPTAFIELLMGVGAFAVAGVSLLLPQLGLGIQIGLWMVFSLGLVLGTRKLLPKRTPYSIADSQEAQTLTEILPGQPGRVLYEGNSWRAMCDDPQEAIAAQEMVYVLRREGNTLIVIPQKMLNS